MEKTEKSDKFNSFYSLKNETVAHLEEIVGELSGKINKIKKTVDIEELLEMMKGLDSYAKHQSKINPESDSDITSVFKSQVFPELGEIINANKPLYSLIQAANNIDRNKFGHWGLNEWPEISPKKISDKIYLVLKNNGEPMHFTEIAEKINEVGFDQKKANPGTCHNELILDDRYVLTDRGMYGLKEWAK
jgi:DNA-directed RNA polymerase subunit F